MAASAIVLYRTYSARMDSTIVIMDHRRARRLPLGIREKPFERLAHNLPRHRVAAFILAVGDVVAVDFELGGKSPAGAIDRHLDVVETVRNEDVGVALAAKRN